MKENIVEFLIANFDTSIGMSIALVIVSQRPRPSERFRASFEAFSRRKCIEFDWISSKGSTMKGTILDRVVLKLETKYFLFLPYEMSTHMHHTYIHPTPVGSYTRSYSFQIHNKKTLFHIFLARELQFLELFLGKVSSLEFLYFRLYLRDQKSNKTARGRCCH